MEFSYFTFNDQSIILKNPLKHLNKYYDPESCSDFLFHYTKSHKNECENPEEFAKISHWWKRKWQVSLDYYLSSISSQNKIPIINHENFTTTQNIDFSLPELNNECKNDVTATQALLKRKTHRKFSENSLPIQSFSSVIRQLKDEILPGIWKYYLGIFNVEGIAPGIYCYHPAEKGLSVIKTGLFRNEFTQLLCGMTASNTASFIVILSVDLDEAQKRFPYNRALREIYIDSGRLAQKLIINGIQHNIGGLPSPAMHDSEMCNFLNIDPAHCIPIYTVTMGIIGENPQIFTVTS